MPAPSASPDPPDPPGPLTAWVDESMHEPMGTLDTATYLLAATLVDHARCEEIRDHLRQLLTGTARRLHWQETRQRHRVISAAVGTLDLAHTVVIGTPLNLRRQERGRRQCLERLLFELAGRNVTTVWLESRTDSLNRHDVALVSAARSAHLIPPGLQVRFARPQQEPMLWIPDAVLGALGAELKGTHHEPYRLLKSTVERITIHLR